MKKQKGLLSQKKEALFDKIESLSRSGPTALIGTLSRISATFFQVIIID